MNLVPVTAYLVELTQKKGAVWVGHDFTEVRNDDRWVDTITDTGTALVNDGVNGVLTLTASDCTVGNNDECYVASAKELFLYGTNRAIYGVWKFRYTAVVAADPNVFVGFQNAVGANSLGDDGAGPKVTGSTLAVGKVDGETVFRVWSSCNGTSTTTKTDKAIAAATDYVVEIFVSDWDGVSMQVSFKVDGEYLRDENHQIIRHTVAIANATEMQLVAGGIKLGAATNSDTMLVDYAYGAQTRV